MKRWNIGPFQAGMFCLLPLLSQLAGAVGITVSKSAKSTQDLGAAVDFNISASDYTAGLAYRVRIKGTFSDDSWQTVQDWGSVATYLWDSSGFIGRNVLEFKVKDLVTGEIATKRYTYYIHDPQDPPATGTTLVLGPNGGQYESLGVQLTAQGQGGSGVYEHYVRYRSELTGNTWTLLQDWSTNSTLTVDLPAADYDFQLRTRNQGSQDKYVAKKIAYAIHPATPLSAIILPDPALDQCLRDTAAGMGWQVAEQVSTLKCQRMGIKTSAGVEVLTALTSLDLSHNDLTMLEGMDQLSQLTQLNLSGNAQLTLEDWGGEPGPSLRMVIEQNPGLTDLRLSDIDITSVPQLTDHVGRPYALRILHLDRTGFMDLYSLFWYPTIERLSLHASELEEVHDLVSLPELQRLDLQGSPNLKCWSLEHLTNQVSGLQVIGADCTMP